MEALRSKINTIAVSRRELKYLVSLVDRVYLLNALSKILKPDEYGGYNGYSVRSLYFDSISNEDYIEKLVKTDERKRVRLRIYSTRDTVVKFEIKRKSFGRELKETIVISKEDAQEVINRNYEVLLNYDSDISEYAYDLMKTHNYRPVALVEYDRRAFTHRDFNTRITLDNNLRYCNFEYDLFKENINFIQALPKDKTILEVKYDRFLFSQIQDVLQSCDLSGKPPSKFGSARGLLMKYYY
ncbi:VTC domain-containing protein [Clostridium collagenovorans DSM 3089]|uniref:VTC domain-containing protein n=1 Tax=Clostridium collagenovorans DSM 3089 TaxID=1121306 RepID=A0A1M5WU30_9CLOT|nr:polyphosphate polymerase domain-containing protein [Clostridium collagenovorans]SHH91099.1 VTC domain-containing protein [Clostridium collagenovorans DSM 3089]